MRLALFLFFLLCLSPVQAHYFVANPTTIVTTLHFDVEPPVAMVAEHASIQLSSINNGTPITDLDVIHERRMHVFIVGSDLATFNHIHPEDFPDGFSLQAYGIYQITHTFEKAGTYVVALDYTINGANSLQLITVNVTGQPPLPPPNLQESRNDTVSGDTVTLKAPATIVAGVETPIDVFLQENGQNITDLQLYLGSELHAFIIKQDLSEALHTHAYIPGHSLHSGTMSQHYSGPTIPLRVTFPTPGKYAIFAQYEHQDTLRTARFLVNVVPPENMTLGAYNMKMQIKNFVLTWAETLIMTIGFVVVCTFLLFYELKKRRR